MDDIRKDLTGNASDQSKNSEVWDISLDLMQYSLIDENRSVVYDATQTIPANREVFIRLAREYGAEKIQGVFFDVPLEIVLERMSTRDRKVPKEVIEAMHKDLLDYPPSTGEGIDAIFKINSEGRLVKRSTEKL